jgi:hypothetical protein
MQENNARAAAHLAVTNFGPCAGYFRYKLSIGKGNTVSAHSLESRWLKEGHVRTRDRGIKPGGTRAKGSKREVGFASIEAAIC